MRNVSIIFIAFLFILSSCKNEMKETSNAITNEKEISFYTADSIKIYGDLYEIDKKASTILLFHQGGSNARAEYGTIIPRLIERGFNILAIDQRSGGQWYGNYNRTLADIPTNVFGDGYTYCDAYNNLEGALDFITEVGFTGKKILWGSSYSASLSIQLGHNRQSEVDGILAFSPATGGSMKNCLPDKYFGSLEIPLLLLRPTSEMGNENVKKQFDLAEKFNHQTYVPENGIHGSSMLVAERVGHEVEDTWTIVLSFLTKIEKE